MGVRAKNFDRGLKFHGNLETITDYTISVGIALYARAPALRHVRLASRGKGVTGCAGASVLIAERFQPFTKYLANAEVLVVNLGCHRKLMTAPCCPRCGSARQGTSSTWRRSPASCRMFPAPHTRRRSAGFWG